METVFSLFFFLPLHLPYGTMSTSAPPTSATESVLVASGPMPEGAQEVRGVDFDKFQGRDITVAEMVENMTHMGFQGSAVAEAARIINEMVRHSLQPRPGR